MTTSKLPQKLITALKKLGYRVINNFYFKPIGYHLLVCKQYQNEFIVSNYFLSLTNEILVYKSYILDNQNCYEDKLKEIEAYGEFNINAKSDFGFLTQEEIIRELL